MFPCNVSVQCMQCFFAEGGLRPFVLTLINMTYLLVVLIASLVFLNYILCNVISLDLNISFLKVAVVGTVVPFVGPLVMQCFMSKKTDESFHYTSVP